MCRFECWVAGVLVCMSTVAVADGPPPGTGGTMPQASIHRIDADAARGRQRVPAESPPASASAPIGRQPRPVAPFKHVHGFHPYWMGTSWQGYDWSLLSTVAWFGIELGAAGQVNDAHGGVPAALVSAAHAAGVRVLVTAIAFDSADLQTLLASAANRQAAVASIVNAAIAAGADGACIDFEGVPGPRKADFVTFVGQVRAALTDALAEPYLSVCTPAVDWGNAYDYDEIAARCDHLLVMAYDYHWANSTTTGPVAPLGGWGTYNVGWTIQDYVTWGAPRHKILLGVPWYGYRWPCASSAAGAATTGTATALTYAGAAAEAAMYAVQWDAPSQTPWLRYQNPDWLQTWYDDAASWSAKFARVWSEELGGVGIWALGYQGTHAEPWTALRDAFGARVADAGPTREPADLTMTLAGANPFAESIAFDLRLAASPTSSEMRVEIYSVDGRCVRRLWRGPSSTSLRLAWDGRDDDGRILGNGIFFVRATTAEAATVVRVVHLRR
jgi:hypothetical protein